MSAKLNREISKMLSDASVIKLENFIFSYGTVLKFNSPTSILKKTSEIKQEYYNLLNKNIIDTNIQENDLFTKKIKLYGKDYKYYPTQKSNLIIEDIDLSYFVNDSIKNLLFYLNILEEFYKNITEYLNNNYKIDNNIYNHNFVILCNYILDDSTNKLVSLEESYNITFKLNKKFFEESVGEPFIYNTNKSKNISTLNYLFSKIESSDLKNNFNVVNTENTWAKTKTGYVKFQDLKINLNHMILVLLYSYISDNERWENKKTNLIKIIDIYNTVLDNKNLVLKSEMKIIDDSIRKSSNKVTEESDKIKEAITTTKKLKNINDAIKDKSNKLKHMNENINNQQNKLNKINTVFIVAIILFILLTLLLIFIKYAKKSIIYLASIVGVVLYIIIYFYILSIKITSKNVAEHFSNDNNKNILIASDKKITEIKFRATDILTRNTENTNSYYDIINPLLNNELKNFQHKSYNNKLYNKIAQFNLNVSKRDIKYNIETIIFLMNLSMLLLLLIIFMYYKPDYLILYGTIALIIFILLAIVYFFRILRVVRTKSNNYYWNKPVKEKEL